MVVTEYVFLIDTIKIISYVLSTTPYPLDYFGIDIHTSAMYM